MNEYSRELMHWAFGEKKKNHKYIDRIRDTVHDTWRYIYERSAETSNKNRQMVKNAVDTWKDGAQTIKSKTKGLFDKVNKTATNIAKEKYKSYTVYNPDTKKVETYKDIEDYYKKKQETEERAKREKQQKREKLVDDAKVFVNKILKKIGVDYRLPTKYDNIKIGQKYARNYNDVYVPESVKTPPRPIVGKSQMEDGRLVIFHDEKDKEEWDRIQKYQKDEPEFMKDIKNIEPNVWGKLPSREDNMAKTNPEYWDRKNASVNCWHCSTAYDLRKRGYDVSALAVESEYSINDLSSFYDVDLMDALGNKVDSRSDATRGITGSAAQKEAQDEIYQYALSRKDSDTLAGYYDLEYGYYARGDKVLLMNDIHDTNDGTFAIHPVVAVSNYVEAHSGESARECVRENSKFGECMSNTLTKRIDKFPDDSWGRISVYWKDGGGHSFAWEKDASGNITFIDAQTNQTVDIKAYMSDASPFMPVTVSRTDNLEVKELVKDYIMDNDGSKNKRKDEG